MIVALRRNGVIKNDKAVPKATGFGLHCEHHEWKIGCSICRAKAVHNAVQTLITVPAIIVQDRAVKQKPKMAPDKLSSWHFKMGDDGVNVWAIESRRDAGNIRPVG